MIEEEAIVWLLVGGGVGFTVGYITGILRDIRNELQNISISSRGDSR